MKPSSSDYDEQDREIIKLLQELGSLRSTYPPELLAARRAAFIARIEQLRRANVEEGLDPGDEQIVKVLATLRSVNGEYPADLLAARRSAFLDQIERTRTISLLDKVRFAIQNIFQYKLSFPAVPFSTLWRTSLIAAVLMIAAFISSLLFSHTQQQVARPTLGLPTNTSEIAAIICKPDDRTPSCSAREMDSGHDLADHANGVARPAVSKDARSSNGTSYPAAYVNDGRSDTSWVGNSANSWVKIDLGKVRTINTVTLQKGSLHSSQDNQLGQFVIAVAQSDVYSDGNSSNDYTEYAQVFNSEQSGFSGTVSQGETVRTQFPPVRARFIKLTFQKAAATIEEVGVFMVQPSELVGPPAGALPNSEPQASATPISANTLLPMDTETSLPTETGLPTETLPSLFIDTGSPTDITIPLPTDTPIPLSTDTLPLGNTTTPGPTDPLPSDTPIPFPTAVLPTAIPPTAQSLPATTDPIIVTGSDQNLTFTCNGNAVEVRGSANTVTLLGSCSSITVTGNRNQIFWQDGSPVITNKGKQNIISQG